MVIPLLKLSRKPDSSKGQNGIVLVIGGNYMYHGAPFFAAMAALKTGVDLAVVAAPSNAAKAIRELSPELIVRGFKGKEFTPNHISTILNLAKKSDVVVIGNGLGNKSDDFVRKLVRRMEKPLVIDADAIKSLKMKDLEKKEFILTPHAKEFEIFLDNSGIKSIKKMKDASKRAKAMQNLLKKHQVILLKGPEDYIFNSNKLFINRTGNSSMTKGGTGDILAGIAAGYLAQTGKFFPSASMAAYNSGVIGEDLFKKHNFGWLTGAMLGKIRKIK